MLKEYGGEALKHGHGLDDDSHGSIVSNMGDLGAPEITGESRVAIKMAQVKPQTCRHTLLKLKDGVPWLFQRSSTLSLSLSCGEATAAVTGGACQYTSK